MLVPSMFLGAESSIYSEPKSKIVEITTSGQHIRTIQHDPVDNKQLFDQPRLICTNINGDIIVTENAKAVAVTQRGHKRFVYHAEGTQLKYLFNPECIVIDKHGLIIISDYYNSLVHVLEKDGKFIQYMITQEQGCGRQIGLDLDDHGRLSVCNDEKQEIKIIKICEKQYAT
ncbi:hypothetical protein KUTeg_011432 [Tegillarca granosa]|uniref:Uncharacterized protein n=1 Tax=Tegillarca granosa TaxID=220873 RepID=A0ABQ9F0S0_TEGGR|nr:hypothetical protein KUTeg_011432 [Tegillarca granosa]